MDSLPSPPTSCDKNTRNSIRNILNELGFKDTPQSRKLDPWMIDVLAREEEACSASKPSMLLLPDINHSAVPLIKKHHNTNYKKRPSNDVDSQNYKHAFVGKRQKKNLSSKKQQNPIAPRSRLVNRTVPALVEKELPVELRNMIVEKMGGSELLFVIEKTLTRTDVTPGQSRLSIPERQVANQFLNIEEKVNVKNKGMNVKLVVCNHDYQPGDSDEIKVKDVNLTVWALRSSNSYVLNNTWNSIVHEQKLGENMLVQLWTFRVQPQIYFFLVKL